MKKVCIVLFALVCLAGFAFAADKASPLALPRRPSRLWSIRATCSPMSASAGADFPAAPSTSLPASISAEPSQ